MFRCPTGTILGHNYFDTVNHAPFLGFALAFKAAVVGGLTLLVCPFTMLAGTSSLGFIFQHPKDARLTVDIGYKDISSCPNSNRASTEIMIYWL